MQLKIIDSLDRIGTDDIVTVLDDVVCARMLTEHGLLDKLQPSPPFTCATYLFETKTHWGMARKDVGHEVKRDNGYTITFIPKSIMDRQAASDFMADWLNATTSGGLRAVIFNVLPLAVN